MAKGGITQYNVKWVGYNNKDNTWEPIEHLAGCEDMIAVERVFSAAGKMHSDLHRSRRRTRRSSTRSSRRSTRTESRECEGAGERGRAADGWLRATGREGAGGADGWLLSGWYLGVGAS